jgi:hypothetical protein
MKSRLVDSSHPVHMLSRLRTRQRISTSGCIGRVRLALCGAAGAVMLTGCYYPYGYYPGYYPAYYATVPASAAQREVPVGTVGGTGTDPQAGQQAMQGQQGQQGQQVEQQPGSSYPPATYVVAQPPVYVAPAYPAYYPPPVYPPWYGYGYPGWYGPSVSIGFGWWSGGHGHGHGYHH